MSCSGKHLERFNFCSHFPLGLCYSFNSSPWRGWAGIKLLSQEARRKLPVKKVWGQWLGFDREQLSTSTDSSCAAYGLRLRPAIYRRRPLSSGCPGILETCSDNRWVGASCDNLSSGQGAQASAESLWGSQHISEGRHCQSKRLLLREKPGAEGAVSDLRLQEGRDKLLSPLGQN